MSTRSRIGRVLRNGSIHSVYCHSDGYLNGVGRTLYEHYTDPRKIAALIKLGDLSCLKKEVEPPAGSPPHHFEYPARVPDVTVAYRRDRGDKDCNYVVSRTVDDLLKIESWQEFVYLWDAGRWRVWSTHDGSTIQGGDLTIELIAEALIG